MEAREVFAQKGYDVDYRNVKREASDLEQMLKYSAGNRAVPVIVEDGKVSVGYGGS